MRQLYRGVSGLLGCCLIFADHWPLATGHWPLATGHWIAEADIPRTIHYQGKLEEADGSPVFGEHTVTMRLYDAPTGGTKFWEERHDLNFTVEDKGALSLDLGSKIPFAGLVSFADPVWLSIEIDATGELVPRQALTSSGYALNADQLDGLDSTQVLRADIDTLAKGRLELARSGLSLLVKPKPNPAANTRLVDVQDASGDSKFNVDLEGDVSIAGSLSVGGSIGGSTSVTGTTSPSWTVGSGTDAAANTLSVLFGQAANHESIAFQGAGTDDFVFSDDVRLSAQGELRLEDAAGGEYLALRSPASVTTHTLTFPAALGNPGQILSTDSAGNLSWVTDATSGGTISEVVAGAGLSGGGTSGSVTVNVGAGTGISISADAIAVDAGTTAGKIVQLDGTGALPAVSGSNLTSLNASNLSSGTVPDARLSASVSLLGPSIESAELTDATVVAADTSDTFLTAGSGATVTKTAASWQISATGTGGNRVTQSASNTLAISTAGDTTLLSATITKSQASSALLVLASVQLTHDGGANDKTVDVKLFRDATQLDSGYEVRLGTASRTVSDIPVSLHTVDTSGAGTYTFTLRARSNGAGAQATVRRLTVIELL